MAISVLLLDAGARFAALGGWMAARQPSATLPGTGADHRAIGRILLQRG